jgi:hypothetical protein
VTGAGGGNVVGAKVTGGGEGGGTVVGASVTDGGGGPTVVGTGEVILGTRGGAIGAAVVVVTGAGGAGARVAGEAAPFIWPTATPLIVAAREPGVSVNAALMPPAATKAIRATLIPSRLLM